MPLKLDRNIVIGSRERKYIQDFKYSLCSVDDIRELALKNKIISVGDVTGTIHKYL